MQFCILTIFKISKACLRVVQLNTVAAFSIGRRPKLGIPSATSEKGLRRWTGSSEVWIRASVSITECVAAVQPLEIFKHSLWITNYSFCYKILTGTPPPYISGGHT